jgi:hypothetical protein
MSSTNDSVSIDLVSFDRDGFVILDNVLPLEVFEAAKHACEKVIEKGRTGQWSHR